MWYNKNKKIHIKKPFQLKGVFEIMTISKISNKKMSFVVKNINDSFTASKSPKDNTNYSVGAFNARLKKYNPKSNVCFICPNSTVEFVSTVNKTVPSSEKINDMRKSASFFEVDFY